MFAVLEISLYPGTVALHILRVAVLIHAYARPPTHTASRSSVAGVGRSDPEFLGALASL